MYADDRIYSSKEFSAPEDFDSSRINSGKTDIYGYNKTHNDIKSANLNALNEKGEIENSSKSKKSNESNENKVKKILKFLLIHVGIFLLVLVYAIGGAFLFQLLEQHQEIQNCQLAEGKTQELIKDYGSQLKVYILYNITTNPWIDNSTSNKDPPKVFNPKISSMLKEMRDDFLTFFSKYKYTGQDCEKQSLWTFSSAFLFALTIVTTIGYGHITPTTWEGQIVCICYATVGIPLFLLGVANISSISSDMSRFLYRTISLFLRSVFKTEPKDSDLDKTDESEKSENDEGKVTNSEKYLNDEEVADENGQVNFTEDDEEEEKSKVAVPLFFIFLIFGGYLYGGSIVFSNIESWTDIQAAYFSYVSLSTMGFGDLVPGLASIQANDNSKGSRNLILATIYITIGMALLAMCFELIQDQIVNKLKRFSQMIGIHSSEDDNEEAEINENDQFDIDDEKQNDPPVEPSNDYDSNLEVKYTYHSDDFVDEDPPSFKAESKSADRTNKLFVRSASTRKPKSEERNGTESKC